MTASVIITLALFHAAIFGFCGWVIKRHFVDKRWLHDGSRFIGRNVYAQWQNGDEQNRIEYVVYVEEDEREDAAFGEEAKDGSWLTVKPGAGFSPA